MSYLQKWISILLAWWIVPVTLLVFWARYLRRHEFVGTIFHTAVVAISVTGAIFLYRLASFTLGGAVRRPFRWWSAVTSFRAYVPLTVTLASGAVLVALSVGAINGVRSGSIDDNWWPQSAGWRTWVPRAMSLIGYTPFADLKEADVSVKPPTWTGKEDTDQLLSVKGLRLNSVDLRYGDMRGAFLAGTVLADAHFEHSDLLDADLRKAKCAGAHMEGASLQGAHLDETNLAEADLTGGDLSGASLSGAEMK